MSETNESTKSKGKVENEPKPQTQSGTSSVGRKGSTSTPERTKEEFDTLNKTASDLGRENKELKGQLSLTQKQLTDYQALVSKKDAEIERLAAKRDDLEKRCDELSSDDPEKSNYVKKIREFVAKEDKISDDREKLDQDIKKYAERIKRAEDTLLTNTIKEITPEYKGGNPEKLKALCQQYNLTTEEEIRSLADNIWDKVEGKPDAIPPKHEPIHVPAGITTGGDGLLGLSPKERVKEVDRRLRAK